MLIAAALMGYLIGSIPFGYIMGIIRGVDIRRHGSGNIGMTNALRLLGVKIAIFVLILDVSKGFVACLLAVLLFGVNTPWFAAVAGIGAIAGHNWSIFLRFRGGKGAATTLGVFLYLTPEVVPIALSVTVLSVILTRYMSLGSVMGTAVGAMVALVLEYPVGYKVAAVVAAVWSFWQHRGNISRLQSGSERRIGESKDHEERGAE